MRGFEPPRIAPYAPEAYAYTNSATCPYLILLCTAKLCGNPQSEVVDLSRIELESRHCERRVIPLDHRPVHSKGIEPLAFPV